jgi:predicted house-cleaning noncanonical NTP pyrophosphatase (MazG superfamily)
VSKRQILNKLVRDRIPEIIEQSGNRYDVEVMSEIDYRAALRQKIIEEAQEVAIAASPDELIKELADLQEVIDAILLAEKIKRSDVDQVQEKRRDQRGGFSRRLKLIWSEVR